MRLDAPKLPCSSQIRALKLAMHLGHGWLRHTGERVSVQASGTTGKGVCASSWKENKLPAK